jgi:septal ring factor EnvC (AmiA/AmiB activator)
MNNQNRNNYKEVIMTKKIRSITSILAVLAMVTSLFLVGCTSKPTDEELRQLDALKAEVSSLENQIAAKEKEKANLEKQIAEKNGKLQQCQSDKDAVKKATGQ